MHAFGLRLKTRQEFSVTNLFSMLNMYALYGRCRVEAKFPGSNPDMSFCFFPEFCPLNAREREPSVINRIDGCRRAG